MFLDLIVAATFLISTLIAFLRGFIREVLTILGIVGGVTAGIAATPALSPFVQDWIGVDKKAEHPQKFFDLIPYTLAADLLVYGVVFIVVVILLSVFSHYLSGWAKRIGLGPMDRTLGILFGLLRAIVLLALLYMPVYLMVKTEKRDEWFKGSHARVYVEELASKMVSYVPQLEALAGKAGEAIPDSVSDTAREKLQELSTLNGTDSGPSQGYAEQMRKTMDMLLQLQQLSNAGNGAGLEGDGTQLQQLQQQLQQIQQQSPDGNTAGADNPPQISMEQLLQIQEYLQKLQQQQNQQQPQQQP